MKGRAVNCQIQIGSM